MQSYIDKSGLPIEIVKVHPQPKETFPFLVLGMGYPLPKSRRNRWCTDRMKLRPQRAAKKYTQATRDALGVRLSESAQRRESIEGHRAEGQHYHGENGEIYPIIDFTLDDIWNYSAKYGYAWGDAEEVSNLYKEATGECGLRKKKAGADEKTDDPCGARFGCVVCPVVTIDKSTQQMAKTHPYFQPFVDLRNLMIEMYKDPRNKAGRMRSGKELCYGHGTFTVKARMRLYDEFLKAEEDHRLLCKLYGAEPQSMFTPELKQMIVDQWRQDLEEKPWLEDAPELGLYYEVRDGSQGYQMAINTYHESLYSNSN
jgi:DNA sulfur modification protein DndC